MGWQKFKRCEILINSPGCRWQHKQENPLLFEFRKVSPEGEKEAHISLHCSWSCLWNMNPPLPWVLPLWYNLVGIGEVAVDVLHLERVSVTDLVVSAAVVGRLDHNDITPRAAEINCISLAWELSPDQPERQGCSAEPCNTQTKKKL